MKKNNSFKEIVLPVICGIIIAAVLTFVSFNSLVSNDTKSKQDQMLETVLQAQEIIQDGIVYTTPIPMTIHIPATMRYENLKPMSDDRREFLKKLSEDVNTHIPSSPGPKPTYPRAL